MLSVRGGWGCQHFALIIFWIPSPMGISNRRRFNVRGHNIWLCSFVWWVYMTYLRFFIDLCISWKFRFRSVFFDDHNLRRIKRNSLNKSTYKCIQIYHPSKFGCSSFYRFWDLTETGFFLSRDRKRKTKN